MENFFEKYELLDLVKDCESTKIYKARNNFDGNVVYIYLLVDDCCSEFINDVYDNLEMYKNIDNENIMKVYDAGKCCIDGVNYYFIEKEYVEGKSLDDILEDLGRLDVDKALIIARHILDGLNYFYKNKSCDGNLRPRNIFVGIDSEVKLDLLVYPKHDKRDLGYTSPEQAIVDYITIYDDMYSLGVILFRMITGRLPFGEFESREDVFKVVSGGLYFKEEDGLDDQLRYLFVKSLQARPLDRYFDLEEFMVDIDEYLNSMEEDRRIVVIDGSDVSTYYLDDEIVSGNIDNCDDIDDKDDDTECGVIIDEDINVINEDGSIKDIEDMVKDVENDLSYLEGDFEDDSIEGTSKEDENIDEADNDEHQVAEVINMNVVNTHNDEVAEASNMNSSKIDIDKYSYTDNELHDDKNNYKNESMKKENDEDEEVDDEDYGSEKGTKRLKVMVGVLSVAVCVVGVASFTFIKDMMGGSESHEGDNQQGEAVLNMKDNEDEEELNQDPPEVDNNEEDANTNEEETNTEESKTQEETNHRENTTNPGNNHNNNHNNNQNNNQNNTGNNNNSNNNNSQNKPGDETQNDGSNNGSNNNGSNNDGQNNDGTVPPENNESNNGAEDGNTEKPNNPDDGSNGGNNSNNNENPPDNNPSDSNNTEGQQPQIDQPPVQ